MGLFKKVEETKTALKVLGFGATSSGKTLFGLSFPEVCAIDSENGMAFYKNESNLKYILETTSAIETEEALDELEDMNDIKTFIVDSETKIYENMQHSALELAEKRARKKGQSVDDANISQREWGKIKLINKRIQSTKITLASKGINIVSIAQEKEIKEKQGDNWVVVGHAPDTAKGLEYDYDIVLRFYTEENKKEGIVKYYAEVKKDRTRKYKKGDIIENPSFKNWEDVYDSSVSKKESVVDFKKDIEKDEKATESEIENAEKLVSEFKSLISSLDDDKKDMAKGKIKELGLSVKTMKNEDPKKLNELVKYIKSL